MQSLPSTMLCQNSRTLRDWGNRPANPTMAMGVSARREWCTTVLSFKCGGWAGRGSMDVVQTTAEPASSPAIALTASGSRSIV